MRKSIAGCVLTGLLLISTVALQAQKLPKVQMVSLRAPSNFKVDGRATEWNNKLEAYNNNVEFYYTLSNDDKNLYLTVFVPERTVIKRILNGGLTLNVERSGRKRHSQYTRITYPVFDAASWFGGRFGSGVAKDNYAGHNTLTEEERASMIMVGGKVGIALTYHQADSIMHENNDRFKERATNISVAGVAGIDSIISVYNEYGIKAAGSFDIKAGMTCELAIPLKYLPNEGQNTDKLTYQLQINAVLPPPPSINNVNVPNGAMKPQQQATVSGPPPQDATDFWGEYTLAHP